MRKAYRLVLNILAAIARNCLYGYPSETLTELKTQHHGVLARMGGCVWLLGRFGSMLQRAYAVWRLQTQKIETAKCCLVDCKIMYVCVGQWCIPKKNCRVHPQG